MTRSSNECSWVLMSFHRLLLGSWPWSYAVYRWCPPSCQCVALQLEAEHICQICCCDRPTTHGVNPFSTGHRSYEPTHAATCSAFTSLSSKQQRSTQPTPARLCGWKRSALLLNGDGEDWRLLEVMGDYAHDCISIFVQMVNPCQSKSISLTDWVCCILLWKCFCLFTISNVISNPEKVSFPCPVRMQGPFPPQPTAFPRQPTAGQHQLTTWQLRLRGKTRRSPEKSCLVDLLEAAKYIMILRDYIWPNDMRIEM